MIEPLSCLIKPAIIQSKVDFPHPLGHKITTNSPSSIESNIF